jgi:hypothetical protein
VRGRIQAHVEELAGWPRAGEIRGRAGPAIGGLDERGLGGRRAERDRARDAEDHGVDTDGQHQGLSHRALRE